MDAAGAAEVDPRVWLYRADILLELALRLDDPLDEIDDDLVDAIADPWKERIPGALDEARDVILSRPSAARVDEHDLDLLLAVLRPAMLRDWPAVVEKPIGAGVDDSYTLGRVQGVAPLDRAVVWGAADDRVLAALRADTMHWVGSAWDRQLGADMARIIHDAAFAQGLSREAAAAALQAEVGPRFADRSRAYWDLVGGTAVARGRTYGQVESFVQLDVTAVEFVAVMDARTSVICQAMNGRVFPLVELVRVRDTYLGAASPEEAKAAHPWPTSAASIEAMSTEQLAAANIVMPPLHGRCRSQLLPVGFR